MTKFIIWLFGVAVGFLVGKNYDAIKTKLTSYKTKEIASAKTEAAKVETDIKNKL